MKATFKGYINVNQNAVFEVPHGVTSAGVVFCVRHYELKDGIDADQFVIGQEYEIEGIVKESA